MDPADLENRFKYHAPTGNKGEVHDTLRRLCHRLAHQIDLRAPDCREKSLAVTALEECMMWANAAVARHPEQPLGAETRI